MPLSANEIQAYIQAGTVLVSAGIQLGGKLKEMISLFHADHGLTDEQIVAMEQQSIADSQARKAERDKMAAPSNE